ncbi:MAG: hypothetical protein KGY99_04150 [Phycisphaerae bacterium]|nr:hypothetical protein [Phycisphaerae bacterium]
MATEPAPGSVPPVERGLDRRVSEVSFDGTFSEAVGRVRDLADATVIVDWPALDAAGVQRTDTVALEINNVTVAGLLDRILTGVEPTGIRLGWHAADDAIHISTRAGLLSRIRVPAAATTARSTGPAGEAPPARTDAADRSAKRPQLHVKGVPLADVIALLREVSGVNFHVNWRSLEVVGVTRDTPVSIEARNISIATALDLITERVSSGGDTFSRIYWVIDDGIVRIATGRALNATPLRTQTYDIGHLLMVIPDFEAPRFDLDALSGEDDDDDEDGDLWGERDEEDEGESVADQKRRLRENLLKIVRNSIGREMWVEGGGRGSVRLIRNRLVVSQTLLGFKLLSETTRLR